MDPRRIDAACADDELAELEDATRDTETDAGTGLIAAEMAVFALALARAAFAAFAAAAFSACACASCASSQLRSAVGDLAFSAVACRDFLPR